MFEEDDEAGVVKKEIKLVLKTGNFAITEM
jgi:hypothetical protein